MGGGEEPVPLIPGLALTRAEAIAEVRSVLGLSVPIALAELLSYSRFILSMLFLGSLGALPLAAGSLANAFLHITGYSVLLGLSLGMEPLCSQALGARRPDHLLLTLHRSVLFLLSISLPISLLWLRPADILRLIGQDADVAALAQTYIRCSLPDLLTLSFVHPLRVYLQSQSITRPLTLAAAFAAAVNLLACLLLIVVLGAGVPGVAAASAVSNLAFLLFLMCHTALCGGPAWWRPTRECLSGWAPLARLAVPSCLSFCLEWWWYELVIIVCGLLPRPQASVAAMGVLAETTNLLNIFPSSVGTAASTRVGNWLGGKSPRRARASAAVAFAVASVAGVVATIAGAAGGRTWGGLFVGDGETVGMIAAAMPVVGLSELGNCPQVVGCGVLRGSGRPEIGARVYMVAFYAVGLPVAVGLGFGAGMGVIGLCTGLLAAQLCCAGLVIFFVRSTDWDRESRRAESLLAAAQAEEECGVCMARIVDKEEQPLLPDKVAQFNEMKEKAHQICTNV